jgi:hypothetical protein
MADCRAGGGEPLAAPSHIANAPDAVPSCEPSNAAHHAAVARLARSNCGGSGAGDATGLQAPPCGSVDDAGLLSLGSDDILGIMQALESDGGAPPAVADAPETDAANVANYHSHQHHRCQQVRKLASSTRQLDG